MRCCKAALEGARGVPEARQTDGTNAGKMDSPPLDTRAGAEASVGTGTEPMVGASKGCTALRACCTAA